MKPKFRVRPHGTFYTWYKIEERKFFIWHTVCAFFETREQAEAEMQALIDWEW